MINSYCHDEIVLVQQTVDKWGEATWTETTISAYVEKKYLQITSEKGEEVTSTAQIWVPYTDSSDLTAVERVKIDGKYYGIIKIDDCHTFGTDYCRVIYL